MSIHKTAIIIGAGPAGLTAAYELLAKSDIKPIIFELSGEIGGLSRSVNYKGNIIDIGGHRFFSKSDRIVNWWTNIMPLQGAPARDYFKLGIKVPLSHSACHHRPGNPTISIFKAPDPEADDKVFLLRNRLSRIYFLKKFFDYPVQLNMNTLRSLGFIRMLRIGISYLLTLILPKKSEKSLEDLFINRFGQELYRTFFKEYTEKVWGVPCTDIPAEWGIQRIKGLSTARSLLHFFKVLIRQHEKEDTSRIETSLIGQFMYPKFGPGQFWEEVAAEIVASGGELQLRSKVINISENNGLITSVTVQSTDTGTVQTIKGDFFFSSMPVKDLLEAMTPKVPSDVLHIASGLMYRDFLTVGLLVDKLTLRNQTHIKTLNNLIPDNWIYIQDSSVKLGRIQIFNNWSPYMVRSPDKVWLGLEYFCQQGDDLWSKSDVELIEFAGEELEKIGIIKTSSICDGVVIKAPKAYPAYFGSYNKFDCIRTFTDNFENLYLIGRNGMHRYNNMDHSMMTAMVAVENIITGNKDKSNIWKVNLEEGYHEER